MAIDKLNLKAARANVNLTQREAAEKMGITLDRLKNWEEKKSVPKVTDVPAIERVYQIEYKDINFFD